MESVQDTLEKQTRKLEVLKAGNSGALKNKNKKVERLENQIKNTVQRELQSVKLKQAGLVSSQICHVGPMFLACGVGHVPQMCIFLCGSAVIADALMSGTLLNCDTEQQSF